MRKLKSNPALVILAVVLSASSVWAAQVIEAGPAKVLGRDGKGMLVEMSGQKVLFTEGTPYEMGYQQGVLLKEDVRELVQKVLLLARAAKSKDMLGALLAPHRERAEKMQEYFAGTMESAFARTKPFIDERYMEEMKGLADGAELSAEDVQLANIFPELFHCSGFAFFGSATEGGQLYHGRILDYMTDVGLQKHALLWVARPKGYNAFVSVGYAGFVGSVTGMNDEHVGFGEMGGRGEGQWDGMPMTFLMRKGMEECDTLAEAVALFRDTPRTCEYYYVISDAKGPDARGLACRPDLFETVAPGQSHPKLAHAIEDVVLMSAGGRYEKLAALTKEHHGRIDLEIALDAMNRPIAMNSCLHRVLFAPKELKLWVANAAMMHEADYPACYQPYYEYDLKELMAFWDKQMHGPEIVR